MFFIRKIDRKSLAAGAILLLGWLTVLLWAHVARSNTLELAFFDVGQGDAIFFETPQAHQVLIDGGPDATVISRLGEVMPFWDKSIDLVVLTHPDADHVTGLVAVFEHYEVESFLWTGKRKNTKAFLSFEAALQKEGAKVLLARAGDKIALGSSGAELLILYPGAEIDVETEESNETSNETSIVAKLVHGENKVLLPGDTTKKIEKTLLALGTDVKADILKVAHHGSKTSSSREFLEAVNARTAVISVGKDNRFGHPHEKVLANLREYGIDIRRTDQEGTIRFYFK